MFVGHVGVFSPLLAAFELAVGLLIVAGGRFTVVGIAAAMAFHVGLMLFGWGFWLWSVPMLVLLGSLLRVEVRRLGGRPLLLYVPVE